MNPTDTAPVTPRLPYVDESAPDVAALASQIRADRGGRLPNLYRMLLHSPALAQGWLAFLTAVRQQSSLPPAIRELAILRVAILNRSQPEYDAHVAFALKEGLSQAKIDALPGWTDASAFDEQERAALKLADAMTLDVQVSDEAVADVVARFGAQQATELIITIAAYNMTTRFLEVLQIDQEAGRQAPRAG
ncbi:carboxymuconolactone decarboxylase family protein [Bosea caraganae]|uniref:Carboxymuconolactone decarboxylase family protein n=1 Tax=Bosea caraganae TaxID=2763117 RepID=A0A370KZD8_9HYPH|nr:carboxymuconolactone decarboxylase family protein [Bosea caraganae]RDJ20364.1 carboxymuconolactone decarboxylase family protein [Bosea caraganae]RDJ26555.1 carboxymuconolactone decarboxylase family protein [Bosea caraganae]